MSDEVARLIGSINLDPDPAHGDLTPAVHALVRIGLPALPAIMQLLEAEDKYTRLRAQRVFEGVMRAWVRDRTPVVLLICSDAHAWMKLWQENGAFDWEADAAARARAILLWRAWLARVGS